MSYTAKDKVVAFVGKRADLILTQGNPLEDVANVAKREGVMIRGLWFSEDQLRDMLP